MNCRLVCALLLVVIVLALSYPFWGIGYAPGFLLNRRLIRLGAICVGGCCIAQSSILFQTVACNRILTPAIMGYEAVYLLLQALLILVLGTASLVVISEMGNAALSALVMLGWSWGLHTMLFRDGRSNITFLLLVGLVLTLIIGTVTQFIQLRISPGEFAIFQSFALISFDGISPERLLISGIVTAVASFVILRRHAIWDTMALGRTQAVSIGLDHDHNVRLSLGLIALLVATSTSLVGPSAFMGIFVANTAYAIAGSFRHRLTLPIGCLVAVAMFLIADTLTQHVIQFPTSVGILINMGCGAYFCFIILRPRSLA